LNKQWIRKGSLALAATLMLTLLLPTGAMADDSIVEIKRDNVGSQVLAYSPTVKGLELDLASFSRTYWDLKETMEPLNDIYVSLDAYESLDDRYKSLSSSYSIYIGMIASGDPTNAAIAMSMVDGDVPDTDLDANGLSNADELALAAEVELMPLDSYIMYVTLKAKFAAFGFNSPNISRQDEYDTFVYPIKVAPLALKNGTRLLGVGIEQAKAGIKVGAESLFDAAVMLRGFESLQKLSYEMAQDTSVSAKKKYELGQISELDYKQAMNDEQIAKLKYESIQRDVENTEMSLNVMLGQPVLTPLALVSEVGELQTLKPVETYIERALEARAEIMNNGYNRNYVSDQVYYAEKYLGTNAIEYVRSNNEFKDLELEKAYELDAVAADVQKAYMSVIEHEESFRISKLTMEDAQRQQKDMAVRVELGYVTESMAKGLDILVVQATDDYYKTYRDYMSAVTALELASGIGSSMGGN